MMLGKGLRCLVPLFLVFLTKLDVQAMQAKYEATYPSGHMRTPRDWKHLPQLEQQGSQAAKVTMSAAAPLRNADEDGSSDEPSDDDEDQKLVDDQASGPGCCSSPPTWIVKMRSCGKGATSVERVRNRHNQAVTRVRFGETHDEEHDQPITRAVDYTWDQRCPARWIMMMNKKTIYLRRDPETGEETELVNRCDDVEAECCVAIVMVVVVVVSVGVYMLCALVWHGSDYTGCLMDNAGCQKEGKGKDCLAQLCAQFKRGATTLAPTWMHTIAPVAITTTVRPRAPTQEEISRVMHYLQDHPALRKLQENAGRVLGWLGRKGLDVLVHNGTKFD